MITQLITSQQEIDICNKYKNGMLLKDIYSYYKISDWHIKKIIKKNNLPARPLGSWVKKYSFDETFFKRIDTEEKAYWLGFLYADGCITDNGVNLLLHQNDIEVLEKFKSDIKYTGKIEIRNDKINYGLKYGIKISPTAKVRIHSMSLRNDLIKLGCMPKKTFILKFPTEDMVPNSLISHFIRGYFDGDGSVWEKTRRRKDGIKRGTAQITSTLSVCLGIREFIIKNYKINNQSIHLRRHPSSKGIYIITFTNLKSMFALRKCLYENSTVYLQRKRKKFYELRLDKIDYKFQEAEKIILNYLNKHDNVSVYNIIELGYTYSVSNRALNNLENNGKIKFSHRTNLIKNYCSIIQEPKIET